MTSPLSNPGRLLRLSSSTLLIAQFILMWTTFFVLSAAIGWPASLDNPASIALPRLLENENAVILGYSCYLVAALLVVPATVALNAALDLSALLGSFTMGLAILSAVAKSIGITRWLFAMPDLARSYVASDADHAAVTIVYDALNDYAGGIGEILGVGLFAGLWTIVMGLAIRTKGQGEAQVVGWFAIVAGAGLFLTIPAGFGVELGAMLTVSNIVWQFSLLFVAFHLLRRSRA